MVGSGESSRSDKKRLSLFRGRELASRLPPLRRNNNKTHTHTHTSPPSLSLSYSLTRGLIDSQGRAPLRAWPSRNERREWLGGGLALREHAHLRLGFFVGGGRQASQEATPLHSTTSRVWLARRQTLLARELVRASFLSHLCQSRRVQHHPDGPRALAHSLQFSTIQAHDEPKFESSCAR